MNFLPLLPSLRHPSTHVLPPLPSPVGSMASSYLSVCPHFLLEDSLDKQTLGPPESVSPWKKKKTRFKLRKGIVGLFRFFFSFFMNHHGNLQLQRMPTVLLSSEEEIYIHTLAPKVFLSLVSFSLTFPASVAQKAHRGLAGGSKGL